MTKRMVNLCNAVCLLTMSVISFSTGWTYRELPYWITLAMFFYAAYSVVINLVFVMRETCVKEKEIQPLEVERIVTYDNCASDEEKAERIKLDRALGTLDCIYTDLAANYNGEISILEDMVDKKSGEVCQLRAKLFQIRNDNGSIKVTRENVEEIEHELNTRENELAKAVYRLRDSSMKDFSLAYKRRQVNLNQYNWKKVYLTPDVVREELAKLAQEQEEANAELEALKARNQELRRQTQYLL